MAENTCIIRQQNMTEGPQAHVLFFGGARVLKEEDAPLFDEELKRYANEHDYRCGALEIGEDTAAWLQEQDVGIVSLPCMTREELAALRACLKSSAGIGIGENQAQASRPEVIAVNGVRLGFLSVGETKPNNEGDCADEADIQDLAVYDHVRMLLPQCDHVIVFCRAGLTDFDMPLPEWRQRYRRLIEAGASVVLGVQSNQAMGWEEYGRGVVFYGLGNLTDARVEGPTGSLAVSISFERNGRFTYESRLLEAGSATIAFSNDSAMKEEINAKNVLLMDEARYLEETERACVAFYQTEGYATLLNASTKRSMFSGLLRKKQEENRQINETMLKDLLADTSRRYAVLRALNSKRQVEDGDSE